MPCSPAPRLLQSPHLQVIDTGIGIPADFQPHIFSSFTQATEARTRHHGGLGLGLAICSHLARLMGAELSVQSNAHGPGATATVAMSLPVVLPNGVPAPLLPAAASVAVATEDSELEWKSRAAEQRLASCVAVVHVANGALRRQLHTSVGAIGMRAIDADSLAYSDVAVEESRERTCVLICMRADVSRALQAGWRQARCCSSTSDPGLRKMRSSA